MVTVYNKKCLDRNHQNIHDVLDKCPICDSSNLFQDGIKK